LVDIQLRKLLKIKPPHVDLIPVLKCYAYIIDDALNEREKIKTLYIQNSLNISIKGWENNVYIYNKKNRSKTSGVNKLYKIENEQIESESNSHYFAKINIVYITLK